MKKIINVFLFIIIVLNTNKVSAQKDSLFNDPNFTKHFTLSETFFGSEDMYQVCYPKDHRSFFYSIIIFSISTLVLGLLVIYIKTNSNKKLKEKNAIIAEQNKDLIDSINYAQRIQQAILPDKKIVDDVFSNGFVLYKPKHIVSGDFYWVHECNGLLFAAVLDCTGHGVPGAFLTMLGYNAINKAVIEKELTDPTLILDSMNTDVKNALKQAQYNSVQDSMEAGLVCIDKTNKVIKFSGANISLQLIHKGHSQVITSGKCSVGSVQQKVIELPHTHELKLNEGDSFYLYSDGYADQFGGPKGKKFKYKQLEEILTKNAHLPLHQQMEMLNQHFEDWKGKLEQVDDVTVLGYRMA